ncbi:NlpC/P60 family protein [Blastococcus aurantiacus]|uniref:NlpC/P60 family protein n=1 Tax=Blastococcus aurantiacus TaxID=1550231 RepID=A0A1G7NJ25_9ACTN|nr:C40 family peptidase [Blastococcus aurantiacus]SDF73966.1 NlpC/P60 family protein [Blastococcus aurantiacus]
MQSARTTQRRRSRAVLALGAALVAVTASVLAPTPAGAAPGTAAEAGELMRKAAQELTVVDEHLHEAELVVAEQRKAAAAAAEKAAAAHEAMAVYEPQLRAIAQTAHTGRSQSRMAAFLTSESADELVQQITTLDLIAARTNAVVSEAATAQRAARQAQAAADEATALAEAGAQQLREQKAEVEKRAAEYQSDFARLSAAEQERVTTAVAGRSLRAPDVDELPVAPGSAAAVAIAAALQQVGDSYAAGGTGPNAFDCSGLTQYAYSTAGVALPHSSRAQSTLGRQVSRNELQPGDLVFYYSPISHVALYIGNGMVVHARTYGKPVAVTSVDQSGYRFGVRLTG